jgi:SAM-dependent methyltransferase
MNAISTPTPAPLLADEVRRLVTETYDRLACEPGGSFHFHRGPAYAADVLGYDAAELATLPARATARFAGVGRPFALGVLEPGELVLDHACGAGMDVLLAARRVGPQGSVIGVDLTPAMREQARLATQEAGLADRVEIRAGAMEDLPLDDASVDVVLSNGVVNLSPEKARVFAEIGRVLRPGGRLLLADVVLAHELRASRREDPQLWAACVAGALQPWELIDHARAAGLDVAPASTGWDCFAGTAVEARVAASLRVRAMGLVATKPR